MARQSSNLPEVWETGFKARQSEWCQCWARSGVIDTQIFSHPPPTHLPGVKKSHLLTFKHKIQLTIWTALVQDIRLMTKNCVCMVKDSKTT